MKLNTLNVWLDMLLNIFMLLDNLVLLEQILWRAYFLPELRSGMWFHLLGLKPVASKA